MSRRKQVLLLGQAPGAANADPCRYRPLEGRSGERLARLMGLGGYEELTEVFAVGNLLGGWPGKAGPKGDAWDARRAREAADACRDELAEEWDLVVLLGLNVARAFRLHQRRFFAAGPWEPGPLSGAHPCTCASWMYPETGHGPRCPLFRVVVVPHPSGISHWWNRRENLEWAEGNLRGLLAYAS